MTNEIDRSWVNELFLHSFGALVLIGIIGISTMSAPAAMPATTSPGAPATAPSRESLARWVAQLGNADAAVREHARWELLGISRSDLLALPGLLAHRPALNASQRALLHEIAVHVFLATERFQADPDKGFLGVKDIFAVRVALPDTRPAASDDQAGNIDALIDPSAGPPDAGIILSQCMPGFCGYRAFQNGDVILAAREIQWAPIHSVTRLQAVVQAHHAGDPMTFQVLRRGKVIEVNLRVDGLPLALLPPAAPDAISAFFSDRAKAAEEFWKRHFSSLAGEPVS